MIKKLLSVALFSMGMASAYEMSEFTDGGKTYPVVVVDGVSFMAKNLDVPTKNSFCYDDDPANCKKYGRLYTWKDAQSVCPTGWSMVAAEDMEKLVKEKGALKRFNLATAGFRNSKGEFELLDKRLDVWLSDAVDNKNAKYWYYSASSDKSSTNKYSKEGAMSVRCVNYYEPDDCNYSCSCEGGYEIPHAVEFQNAKILVCTYVSVLRSGNSNTECPQDVSYYVKYWKKSSSDTIEECPEPYEEEYEQIEASDLFSDYDEGKEVVVNGKGVCTVKTTGSDVKYADCSPLGRSAGKFTQKGKSLFGL